MTQAMRAVTAVAWELVVGKLDRQCLRHRGDDRILNGVRGLSNRAVTMEKCNEDCERGNQADRRAPQ
jgi:hypothetical protein